MALTNKLTAIADAIREKTNTTDQMTLEQMATSIAGITGGAGDSIPEEAFEITGNCTCRFAYDGWNWFIDIYGDKITTKDIHAISNMFYVSSHLEEIPFEINLTNNIGTYDANYVFKNCQKLTSIPRINNCRPSAIDSIFEGCYRIREIPEDFTDWIDWSLIEGATSGYAGKVSGLFKYCFSLRSFPMSMLTHCNKQASYSCSIYYCMFENCYSLDEIVDYPVLHLLASWTSNAFSNAFNYCGRLKEVTFALQEDNTPYVVNWKSQVIDMSKNVGYAQHKSNITDYNSGITADKQVTDAVTYAALKDDPDWFTTDVAYSRYNHDSAVNTINSLPDTSAYLATAGGTNTIKFKGDAGSATDGGAINTLTEEEIAVAAAKGWTVTFA